MQRHDGKNWFIIHIHYPLVDQTVKPHSNEICNTPRRLAGPLCYCGQAMVAVQTLPHFFLLCAFLCQDRPTAVLPRLPGRTTVFGWNKCSQSRRFVSRECHWWLWGCVQQGKYLWSLTKANKSQQLHSLIYNLIQFLVQVHMQFKGIYKAIVEKKEDNENIEHLRK